MTRGGRNGGLEEKRRKAKIVQEREAKDGKREEIKKKKQQVEERRKASTSLSSGVPDKRPPTAPSSPRSNKRCRWEPLEMERREEREKEAQNGRTGGSHDQLSSEETQSAQKLLLKLNFNSDFSLGVLAFVHATHGKIEAIFLKC